MLAKWLRLGLRSGRVTTTYPVGRTDVLRSHEQWRLLPKLTRVPSEKEAEYLVALCPTKAIRFTQDDEVTRLFIDLSACIACGRCIRPSGEGVVEWNSAIDLAEKATDSLILSISEK